MCPMCDTQSEMKKYSARRVIQRKYILTASVRSIKNKKVAVIH